MHLLFICTKNRVRSLTAEHLFKNHSHHQVRSAGTAVDARRQISFADIVWADVVFVMEKKHQEILEQRFPDQVKNKKLINLNITGDLVYMQPELVEMIRHEVVQVIDDMGYFTASEMQ